MLARRVGLGAVVAGTLLALADASALSLGRMRGTPLIGRPLQVTIPVTLDSTDNPPCVRAEMLQGETPGGPLRWQVERAIDGSTVLRLTSATVVQEPVVTVNLTVGCGQPFTRDYVLLAERPDAASEAANVAASPPALPEALPLALAPSTMLGAVPPVAGAAAEARAPAQAAARPPAPAAEGRSPAPVAEGRSPAPAAAAAAVRPPPPRTRAPRAAQASRAAGTGGERPARRTPAAARAAIEGGTTAPAGPRLRLEPIDIAIDEAPALRISTQLSAVPPAAPLARAESSAVFQAMNTAPENVAAQAQQAKAVEAELKAMRELVQRHSADMKLLTDRLERVSSERNLISNALAGFAILVALALGFLLWRRSREPAGRGDWWQQDEESRPAALPSRAGAAQEAPAQAAFEPVPEGAGAALPAAAAVAAAQPAAASEDGPELDLDFTLPDTGWNPDATTIVPAGAAAAAAAASGAASPAGSAPPSAPPAAAATASFGPYDRSRVPTAEELLDVKEKAEFFLAIAQPDKAIALLETHLHDHLAISPFVWMDVLDLCRRNGRRADYERIRAEFQKTFFVRLPDFDKAATGSRGLEDHPRALSRIMLLWPSERVLRVIEDSLFEDPQPGSIMFDLEASRDLLLLYSIASEVVRAEGDDSGEYPATMHVPAGQLADESADGGGTRPVPLAALDSVRPALDAPGHGRAEPAPVSDSSLAPLDTASALAPLDLSLVPHDPPARGAVDLPVAGSVDLPVDESVDLPPAGSLDLPVAGPLDLPVDPSADLPMAEPLDFSLAGADPLAAAPAAAPAEAALPDIDLSTGGTPLLEEFNFDFEPYKGKAKR